MVHAAEPVNESPLHILVPAYANPCCDGGPEMWRALVETARNPQRNFELVAILNPASGPGQVRDLNYLSEDGKSGVILDFRAAGGKLFGYVSTAYDERQDTDIMADIDGYLKDASRYCGFVDGIFLDELSNDLAGIPRHRKWVAYIKSINAKMKTMANPGVAATLNPSATTEFNEAQYANVFDGLMSFEHSGDSYLNRFTTTTTIKESSTRISHVLHSQPEWDKQWIDHARKRGADYLYVTDDLFRDPQIDNPYDTLPSYWSQMVADISAANQAP